MREKQLAVALVLVLAGAQRVARAQEASLIDPTAPPASALSARADATSSRDSLPRVQSIVFSRSRRVAVIDGVLVEEGDLVAGSVVSAIRPSEVRLRGPHGDVRLPLRLTTAKQPANTRERSAR